MKLAKIETKGFQIIGDFSHEFRAPIMLFCGPNDVGKSTIARAIRYALTGEGLDARTKAERSEYFSPGAKMGAVRVSWDGGDKTRPLIPKGKSPESALTKAQSHCVSFGSLSSLSLPDRAAALIDIMGIDLSPAALADRLANRGIAKKCIEQADLSLPFAEVEKFAATKASESRGAWKAITNETYGSQKAKTWKLEAPEPVPKEEIDALEAAIALSEKRLAELQQEIGAAKSHQVNAKMISDLKARASLGPKAKKDCAELEKKLSATRAELEALPPPGQSEQILACPECGASLKLGAKGLETIGVLAEQDPHIEEMRANAKSLVCELETQLRSAQNTLQSARDARDQLNSMDKESPSPRMDMKTVEDQIATEENEVESMRAELRAANNAAHDTEHAARATKDAREYHGHVERWAALADAMSASGIPADIAAESVDEINARLRQSAGITGWNAVRITPDMRIMVGEYRYEMSGESMRWRADAMIMEAISHLTETKLVIFDGFDVLEPSSRPKLMKWVSKLVSLKQIDTAVLMATLKEPPNFGSAMVDVIWMGDSK